jgi:hypothetical protein
MHHLAKNPEQMIGVEERMIDSVLDEELITRADEIQAALQRRGLA